MFLLKNAFLFVISANLFAVAVSEVKANSITNTPKENLKLTFSQDTNFSKFNLSKQSLTKFAEDAINLEHYIADKIDNWAINKYDNTPSGRTKSFLLSGGAVFWSHLFGTSLTMHEQGHWSRDKAGGRDVGFNNRSFNPHLFYLQNLFSFKYGSDWGDSTTKFVPNESTQYLFDNSVYTTSDWNIVSAAAGFSMDAKYVEIMADKTLNGEGNVRDVIPYVHSKLFPMWYRNLFKNFDEVNDGDIEDLAFSYNERGWDISRDDISNSSILAFLLSGSTYMYFDSFFDYIENGHQEIKPLFINNFKIPDVYAFYEKGISYKISTGYRLNDKFYIPLAVEFVNKGDVSQNTEFSIGLKGRINDKLKIKTTLISGGAVQGNAELSYTMNKNLDVYFGVENNNIKNLEGLRSISSLEKGGDETLGYVGLTFKF